MIDILEPCKLCGNMAKLNKSHVIPEWIYKRTYNKKHKYLHFSVQDENQYGLNQHGVKEYLFCNSCEQLFSDYENYSKHLFYSIANNKFRNIGIIKLDDKRWKLTNIDYSKLKGFILSILYRISISNHIFFSYYKLPIEDIEIIKDILKFRKNTLISVYPISFGRPYLADFYMKNFILFQSGEHSEYGIKVFWIIFSGVLIKIFLSTNNKNEIPKDKILNEDWFIIEDFDLKDSIIMSGVQEIMNKNKVIQDYMKGT